MARVRNVLIDNTLGKVFTSVENVPSATAVNLIAGTKLQTKIIGSAKASVRVTNNISNVGLYFPTESLTTTAVIKFAVAPNTALTKLRIKSGTSYDTSTIIADNITIAANAKTTSYNLNTTIAAGNYIYVDITSAGPNVAAGSGLSVSINYYAN